jgi:hypothetical protein
VNKAYIGLYPSITQLSVTDMTPGVFKERFMQRMGRDISCWFAAHPTEAKQGFD